MIFELLQLVVTFILSIVSISDGSYGNCSGTSSCLAGGIQIQDPFWIPSDTAYTGCTYPGFAIECKGARPVMNISNRLYYVQDIDEIIITLMDPDMDGEKCPRPRHNVSLQSQPFLRSYEKLSIFYNCTIPPGNGWYQLSCLENSYNNKSRRSYAFSSHPDEIPQEFQHWYNYCEESVVVPAYFDRATTFSKSIESIRLYYSYPVDCDDCVLSGGLCSANHTATGGAFSCQCPRIGTRENRICYSYYEGPRKVLVITIYVSIGVGVLLLIVLLIYIRSISHWLYNLILSWKNKIGISANVEAFLENYGCLSLQRYKYIDVKKMTNSFKETLGQGGYGIVYKGKLHDDCLVAVKVLNESKGNGEEFINEVASIGRTNHVNIVSLLGFCTEGNKRALVYEFMSNGSLERFIYNNHQSSTTSTHPLGWEQLYDIALGVSKGLEYLHRGCNTRILHLDIKPHNILLDHNFSPKISDFGLAKLCPTLASVVSMVGPRGTMGYIAPEVYCRNFGGVSHKSDVYSYGMMVLEMIGGRKNIDVTVENISEIYFPQWIYNHFEHGNKVHESEEGNIEGYGEIFGNEKAKKMIIVALWCIQAHPIDRPSMRKVVEMLEGNIDELQMPPNPNMGPQSKHPPSP